MATSIRVQLPTMLVVACLLMPTSIADADTISAGSIQISDLTSSDAESSTDDHIRLVQITQPAPSPSVQPAPLSNPIEPPTPRPPLSTPGRTTPPTLGAQPPQVNPLQRQPRPGRSLSRTRRRSFSRLARAPDMFGDVFGALTISAAAEDLVIGGLPLAGGNRRVKVAEHNRALPTDRVYFLYHHFHNAIQLDRVRMTGGVVPAAFDVDQYTFGFEKTFQCKCWSVEVRMPFTNDQDLTTMPPFAPTADFRMFGGSIGNLSVILKRKIYETEETAIAAGLGINTPTGSDVSGVLPTRVPPISFSVANEAVHLSPYLGITGTPNNRAFYHGFLQVDVALNGNTVTASSLGAFESGRVDEQTLLFVDVGGGYWLHQDCNAKYLTGIAAVAEVHYTTSLQAADSVSLLAGAIDVGNAAGQFDVVNVTTGIHVQVGDKSMFRFGGVFPLTGGDDRFFDAELQGSFIRRF